jgi:long-chain acyl-CoA synthetase
LEKWVFPGLEEETRRRSVIPAHRDLLELLEAAVHAFRHRTALRWMEGDREVRFTYGDLDRYASRVGSFLLRAGLQPQARVLLASESRPEWAFAYFGILRAGGTVVPVDPELSEAEVVNLARRAEASVCLVSEEAAQSLPGLFRALAEAGLPTQVHSLAQAMEGDPSQPNRIGAVKRSASPDDVASLLFTSGTTGNPKGVMLTHRNFTSLVSKLAGAFSVGVGDGLLSVLPLHHTFEFSCGLLTPLSRGADITYLDTLNSERLSDVFETGRITAMIGVPALWQLLHRKLTQELAAGPALVESAVNALMSVNSELRNRKGINLGKLLFWPVHKKFGGRLRFMVSGGAALPEEVHSAFHGLGFQLTEGYGLTEAAPVLTVAERENERHPGSVGRALPGIELKIEEPDASGVGEVLARGPTVMAGYFGDPEATAETVHEGWLRTGDLGRLDEEGRLYLVGRKKDVIVDSNGKNVYPDELEELFSKHPAIKELSVVGLPDEGGGERVACLCVPDYGSRPRGEVRHELEEHFRTIAAQQAFYRRIKVLHFWDGELPKTSTRKVKRKQVVEELKRLERASSSGHQARERRTDDGHAWLLTLVAEVAQRRPDEVHLNSRLVADLGFDSLMVTELSVALEQAGVPLRAIEDLSKLETVENLRQLLASQHKRPASEGRAKEISNELVETQEIAVPETVANLGRSLLSLGQRFLYGGVFEVEVKGKSFIPQNRNCLVVANHASHLDMGLIKVVLGDQGERLAALAARDYFFDTAWKRAYFENFTNLIPIERHGSLRESLKMAGDALNQGLNLLIFPEGTRTTTGELQEFKATLGFLALTYGVDVLPLYLDGTYNALPKGSLFPKQNKLAVRIGPVFTYEAMKRRTEGMSRSASYRHVTEITEQAVRALKDGKVIDPSALTPSSDQQALPAPSVQRSQRGHS